MPQPAINHESLLMKYIRWVGECEGVDFIQSGGGYHREDLFTPDEWQELERLALLSMEDR